MLARGLKKDQKLFIIAQVAEYYSPKEIKQNFKARFGMVLKMTDVGIASIDRTKRYEAQIKKFRDLHDSRIDTLKYAHKINRIATISELVDTCAQPEFIETRIRPVLDDTGAPVIENEKEVVEVIDIMKPINATAVLRGLDQIRKEMELPPSNDKITVNANFSIANKISLAEIRGHSTFNKNLAAASVNIIDIDPEPADSNLLTKIDPQNHQNDDLEI